MVYIDWEWYESNFPQLPEDEFARRLPAAEMKVDILTHNRARDVHFHFSCRQAACKLIFREQIGRAHV